MNTKLSIQKLLFVSLFVTAVAPLRSAEVALVISPVLLSAAVGVFSLPKRACDFYESYKASRRPKFDFTVDAKRARQASPVISEAPVTTNTIEPLSVKSTFTQPTITQFTFSDPVIFAAIDNIDREKRFNAVYSRAMNMKDKSGIEVHLDLVLLNRFAYNNNDLHACSEVFKVLKAGRAANKNFADCSDSMSRSVKNLSWDNVKRGSIAHKASELLKTVQNCTKTNEVVRVIVLLESLSTVTAMSNKNPMNIYLDVEEVTVTLPTRIKQRSDVFQALDELRTETDIIPS